MSEKIKTLEDVAEENKSKIFEITNRRLNAEKKRLKTLFSGIPEKQAKIVDSMINSLAFLNLQLKELEDTIQEEGSVILGPSGLKEHPATKIHAKCVLNALKLSTDLAKMLPIEKKEEVNELTEFLKKKKAK